MYLTTRRCTQRDHLLQPDEEVEQIFEYCLAEAALRFDVTVHGWMVMSNHEHLLVRDNLGNLPDFLAHLHKMLAKVLNAKWGRSENLWSSEQASIVRCIEPGDQLRKLIYLLANPVKADLVEHASDWPGASSFGLHLSRRTKTIVRPERFFRANGPMPEQVTLRAERLEGFEHLSDVEYSEMIAREVGVAEHAARVARVQANRGVLGRKAVLRGQYTDRPATPERRGGLRPLIACLDPVKRARALQALRDFWEAHRSALRKWIAGDHQVVFPAGTFRMKQLGAMCCPGDALAACW